jgi:hypothetical protein
MMRCSNAFPFFLDLSVFIKIADKPNCRSSARSARPGYCAASVAPAHPGIAGIRQNARPLFWSCG